MAHCSWRYKAYSVSSVSPLIVIGGPSTPFWPVTVVPVPGDDETGEGEDCDDNDASVSPEMLEVCGNTVDENCDGEVQLTCDNEDLDGDGQSPDDGDCDDDDADIFAGAVEVCGDGVDNNCNQLTDEGCEEAGFFTVCDSSGSTDRGSLWGLLALIVPLMGIRMGRGLRGPTRGE